MGTLAEIFFRVRPIDALTFRVIALALGPHWLMDKLREKRRGYANAMLRFLHAVKRDGCDAPATLQQLLVAGR
jgi:hypothetical protein